MAAAEKLGSLNTAAFFAEKARQADLAAVPDNRPMAGDELPEGWPQQDA